MRTLLPPAPVATRAAPCSAAALRDEINHRAAAWASRCGLLHDRTTGRSPSVIFGAAEDEAGRAVHGNFHPQSYRAICDDPSWPKRLCKAHTGCRRAMPRADWRWRELDCAASSDALLMNIFCHPDTLRSPAVSALLGVPLGEKPRFGVRVGIPVTSGTSDRTEVDMALGSLLVEAKLTESSFQTAKPALVERFRDLRAVFDVDLLPRTCTRTLGEEWDEGFAGMIAVERGRSGDYTDYQLVRGALAAFATGASFCVLADGRRPDLVEQWHTVLRAVRIAELRCRLQLLTWQEIAPALPSDLQSFLAAKYGIDPACAVGTEVEWSRASKSGRA